MHEMESDVVITGESQPLIEVRRLVGQRSADLDAERERLEMRLADVAERLAELRGRIEEGEQEWSRVLATWGTGSALDVDATFRALASLRSDLAAVEERYRDSNVRLADVQAEQEVLRAVFRTLDDITTAGQQGDTTAKTAQLRKASRQVFKIIEEERMRIARDMHDGPAQSMANLVLQAEILERLLTRDPSLLAKELDDFKKGVREVLNDTRRLIFDLRPMTLDDLGLIPTLRKYVKQYEKETGINTRLRVGGDEVRLTGAYEPTLFRIIQEALNNIRKHSHAKTVDVVVNFAGDHVEAVIHDDGVGFEVGAVDNGPEPSQHLGMISMRERAELEKGTLTVRSQPGQGTEVKATLPYIATDS